MQSHLITIDGKQVIVYNSNREEAIDLTNHYPNCDTMQRINLATSYLTDVKLEKLLSDYFTHNGTIVKYIITPEHVDIDFICKHFNGHVEGGDDKVDETDVLYYRPIEPQNSGFGFEGECFDAMNNPIL